MESRTGACAAGRTSVGGRAIRHRNRTRLGCGKKSLLESLENSSSYVEKQCTTYKETLDVARNLRVLSGLSSPQAQQSYKEFWYLYWGRLLIVESEKVRELMVEVGYRLPNASETKPAGLDGDLDKLIQQLDLERGSCF